jgi:tetratricopeptide (TPR) repeat protein
MLTQDQFNESQQRITSAWHSGNLQDAFAEIDRMLEEGTTEMKGTGLFYRAMIAESQGHWEQVKEDSLNALQYANPGTFLRYQLEHMSGAYYHRLAITEDAVRWYQEALETCDAGSDFSGHKTLAAFMRLRGENISPSDEVLVAAVAKKSWRVLDLPGEPDLTDIRGTIQRLCEHFSRTVEEIDKG